MLAWASFEEAGPEAAWLGLPSTLVGRRCWVSTRIGWLAYSPGKEVAKKVGTPGIVISGVLA